MQENRCKAYREKLAELDEKQRHAIQPIKCSNVEHCDRLRKLRMQERTEWEDEQKAFPSDEDNDEGATKSYQANAKHVSRQVREQLEEVMRRKHEK